MRECGCEDRGRHKRDCLKHIDKVKIREDEGDEKYRGLSMHELYITGYGKPPNLFWYPNKDGQRTVEHKIKGLVKRCKSFYLTTNSLSEDSKKETWYIDGGNWASKIDGNGYNKLIGHIKNCLEFLNGPQPKWEMEIKS